MSNGAPQRKFNRKEFNSKKRRDKQVKFNNPIKDLDKNLLRLEKALTSSDPEAGIENFVNTQIKKNAREKLEILVENQSFGNVNEIFDYLQRVAKTEGQNPIYDVINDIINNGKNADIPKELKSSAEKIKEILSIPRASMSQEQKNLRNDIYNGFDILNVIDINAVDKTKNIRDSKALKKLVKIAMESDWIPGTREKVSTFEKWSGEERAKEMIENIIIAKLDNKNVFDYSYSESKYDIKKAESIIVPFFTNEKFAKLFKELKKDYLSSKDFNPASFTEKILADSQHLLSFKDLAKDLNYNKELLLKIYENPTNLKDTENGLEYLIKYLDDAVNQLEIFNSQNYRPPKLKNKLEENVVNILDEITNNLNMITFENKEVLMKEEIPAKIENLDIVSELESLKAVLERLEVKKSLRVDNSIDYLNNAISDMDLL